MWNPTGWGHWRPWPWKYHCLEVNFWGYLSSDRDGGVAVGWIGKMWESKESTGEVDRQCYVSAWLGYSTQWFNQTLTLMLQWGDFVDVVNIYNQLPLGKDYPWWCGWASSNQLKALRAKTEVSQRRNSAPSLSHQLLPEFPACWKIPACCPPWWKIPACCLPRCLCEPVP